MDTVAAVSFGGDFGAAHSYMDFGGDILGVTQWNMSFVNGWYGCTWNVDIRSSEEQVPGCESGYHEHAGTKLSQPGELFFNLATQMKLFQ